jgi:hypothetical protein
MDELGEADVGSIQPRTQSFVVKVWLVDPERGRGRPGWHGRITHVPSGRNRHFADLGAIAGFIIPYLRLLGVKPALTWKVRLWLGADGGDE